MAATTITRATITDDSGNGTSGTILNAAWVGTAIYDKIDALLTGVTLQQEASNPADTVTLRTKNSSSTGFASHMLGTNEGDNSGALQAFGSSYSTSTSAAASSVRLVSFVSGGLGLVTAGGPHKWWIGTANPMTLAGTGHLVLAEQTTNPGTSELSADAAVSVYTKADKFVIAYNNGGTMTYITLDLDGSDTTWSHSTSAP